MLVASLLTRHHKGRYVAGALQACGIAVMEDDRWDTDQLGSFCGQQAREQSAPATAALKAILAADLSGTELGLGSEGSFGGGPVPGILPWQQELLALYNANTGQIITGRAQGPAPLSATAVADIQSLQQLFERYPGQGWMLRSGESVHKGLLDTEAVLRVLPESTAASGYVWPITLEPDWRAMMSPLRGVRIREAAANLAARLTSFCQACGTADFWHDHAETGLPCRDCGAPTSRVRLTKARCRCGYESVNERADWADPYYCEYCNP